MHALYKLSILTNPSYLYSMHVLHKPSILPNPSYDQLAFHTQDGYNKSIKHKLYQCLRAHIGVKIYLFTAIGLSPGGSGYFTCIQNMKLVTNKFKSGGIHEKHVVATWNVGNHLSICL